jgi:sugar phosphate isomerase/epimerase
MRIGGGLEKYYSTPEEWLTLIKILNYRAVIAPIDHTASPELKQAYRKIIAENDLVLGEVGAWVNPIATDERERYKNITYCQNQLAFAEEMKARCCVDIVGCRGENWDGAYLDNYSEDTYELIVDSIRAIIDAVKPKNTFYTVEPMPWMIPDSPESYLKLIKDVDRKAFGVHLDYTNMINSPTRYLKSSAFITHCFSLLGPYIKSVHAKDVKMENHLPCVIKEVMPGEGIIDFKLVMRLCRQINPDMTIYAEHLDSYEKYAMATSYLMKMEKES